MPSRIPRVQLLAPTRSVERTGGQGTFLAPFSGTQSLGDGVYYINPYEASYGKSNPLEIIKQQALKMSDMAGVAEALGNHEAKRRYGMLDSALEDAWLAGMQKNEDMRLLMQVNKSGSPVGAATFQKGDVYGLGTKDRDLMDLDFTGPEPGTLHSLGVLGMESEGRPMMPGLRYIQKAQDMLGNDNMFFETINKPDHSNLEYYFKLGARPTGKSSSSGNPYYEFKKRAAREPEGPNPKQLRLEGFAGGGMARISKLSRQKIFEMLMGQKFPKGTIPEAEVEMMRDVVPSRLPASSVALRWESAGRKPWDPGIIHYDASGGSQLPDIVQGQRWFFENDYDGPPKDIDAAVRTLFSKGQIRAADLSTLDPKRVGYIDYDGWCGARPTPLNGKTLFYPNTYEGLDATRGIPSYISPNDLINDAAMRRELNMSIATPQRGALHQGSLILKAKGGLVQYKECSCGR